VGPSPLRQDLRAHSEARITGDREFRWISDDLAREKQKIADKPISLNEKARRTELSDDAARKDKRTAERDKHPRTPEKVYLITLDNVDKPQLELVSNQKPKADKNAKPDKDAKVSKTDAADGSDADDDDADDLLGARDKEDLLDPIRIETLNILTDFVGP